MKAAIYLIAGNGQVKIGYSANPWKRYRQLCTGNPVPIALVFTLYCGNARKAEKDLHDAFKDKRSRGEWFAVTVPEVLQMIVDLGIAGNDFRHVEEPAPKETERSSMDKQMSPEEMDEFFGSMEDFLKS